MSFDEEWQAALDRCGSQIQHLGPALWHLAMAGADRHAMAVLRLAQVRCQVAAEPNLAWSEAVSTMLDQFATLAFAHLGICIEPECGHRVAIQLDGLIDTSMPEVDMPARDACVWAGRMLSAKANHDHETWQALLLAGEQRFGSEVVLNAMLLRSTRYLPAVEFVDRDQWEALTGARCPDTAEGLL